MKKTLLLLAGAAIMALGARAATGECERNRRNREKRLHAR